MSSRIILSNRVFEDLVDEGLKILNVEMGNLSPQFHLCQIVKTVLTIVSFMKVSPEKRIFIAEAIIFKHIDNTCVGMHAEGIAVIKDLVQGTMIFHKK